MWRCIGVLGVLTIVSAPVLAQSNPAQARADQMVCDMPGAASMPQCVALETRERDRRRHDDRRPAWVAPVERITVLRGGIMPLVRLPSTLVKEGDPPLWVRVCRQNSAAFNQGTAVFVDAVTQRAAYFTTQGCSYFGFTHSVQLQASEFDNAQFEFQFLGRQ